ncbi:bifunctional 2-C-methyl-D-erythritol 4-phosphate cytidylyltransferase/2-C-methyl-D-erythritol 2,4-cyclodiphosphate synthase [Celeribacter arenosi]|uniref:Bifunctional enzyme IspD/IspF n=1 Tax=Celeribacter arenosi TaxID=792649 RepID=A0ABP7KGY2_9RHOB
MKVAALIVAAGRGTRAGEGLPKQWRPLGTKRVIDHAIAAFRDKACQIVVVHHPDDAEFCCDLDDVVLVHGCSTRSASVRAGLDALAPDITHVLIHDAARALCPPHVIDDVIHALESHDGAAPGLAVTDALWTTSDGHVSGTAKRDGLFRAQTPQGFALPAITAAHAAFDGEAADDVEVARAAGIEVAITKGAEENFKITHADDFTRATAHLQRGKDAMKIRIGNGYDVHRFGPGDHLWLCGVKIPFGRTLQGHSDADVGMHALSDAIYGALAMGDIGQHFPPSDPQWKGAQSHIFLRHAIELARDNGYSLANCDVTLVCEQPKIGPHAAAMRQALADIMGVDVADVSVKATTSEKLGFTGREEGIAALATAALVGGQDG